MVDALTPCDNFRNEKRFTGSIPVMTANNWSVGETGKRAVSTPKEMYRMEELGGHTADISSRIFFKSLQVRILH